MLLENLNGEQNERYITWRRVRLKKEHVRRVRSRKIPIAALTA
jgi:transcription initiation factor TFIID subunit 11